MSTHFVGVDGFHVKRYLACMTPEQCRAARAWLNMSQDALAAAASVSNSTVRDFEAGRREPIQATKAAMKAVLERGGIAFVDGGAWGKDVLGIAVHRTRGKAMNLDGDSPV